MFYIYCPQCKTALKKPQENLWVCPRCDFHLYENPRPTSGSIIENGQGEILLVKRKHPPRENLWDIPGGFVDPYETTEESVVRELKEELKINIKIADIRYATSVPDRYEYKGSNYYTIMSVFVMKLPPDQKPEPNDDISEVKFFSKDEIAFDKLAFESVRKVLKEFTLK